MAARKSEDDVQWAERSEYWRNFQPATKRSRKKKFNFREPLVLCGHGARISADRGTLLIRNGFTHYPQAREDFRFFPGDANLPDRIVVLDGSGGISFDALAWMSEQEIEFLRLDWRGEILSFSGVNGYSANPEIVRAQREISGTRKQIEIGRNIIKNKISNSTRTISDTIPKSENREIALAGLNSQLEKITSPKTNSISKLFGIEGEAARIYFSTWHGLPLKWKSLSRPIPADWHRVGPRTMGWRKRSRAARHPINAMLNYAYGVLKHQIRGRVLAAGFDPTIGILHGNSQNKVPLVYDVMEPFRPVVDRFILEFALAHAFSASDFTISKWGGCRLNPQLSKAVAEMILRNRHVSSLSLVPLRTVGAVVTATEARTKLARLVI
jgi:CRISPR-associated endonuclease Cas1